MSDTKALYDVVEKALANWGDAEAQDAFEAIMRQLRGADDLLATGLMDAVSRIDAEMRDRAQRAEADNAALLKALHSAYRPHAGECRQWSAATGQQVRPCPCGLDALLDAEHPGAALLEELEGLRKQVELQKAVISGLQDGIEEGKATAHNAALEEAAKVADGEPDWIVGKSIARRIRALKKTGQGE